MKYIGLDCYDSELWEAMIYPGMKVKDLLRELKEEFNLVNDNIDERDLAAFLKDKGYNIVIDYEPVYKVGRTHAIN